MLRTDYLSLSLRVNRQENKASRHDARSPMVSSCKTLSREERWGGADVSRYHVYPNVWGATWERRCAPLQPCCARAATCGMQRCKIARRLRMATRPKLRWATNYTQRPKRHLISDRLAVAFSVPQIIDRN